jgi:hypothetical protein
MSPVCQLRAGRLDRRRYSATVQWMRQHRGRIIGWLLVGVTVVAGGGACSNARDRARDEFVDQLVNDGGLSEGEAKCIVDRFFDDRTTDELREFFKNDDLTEAEAAEFGAAAAACRAD